jgi:hypothetical protein
MARWIGIEWLPRARWRSGWPLTEFVKCGAHALQPVLVRGRVRAGTLGDVKNSVRAARAERVNSPCLFRRVAVVCVHSCYFVKEVSDG